LKSGKSPFRGTAGPSTAMLQRILAPKGVARMKAAVRSPSPLNFRTPKLSFAKATPKASFGKASFGKSKFK